MFIDIHTHRPTAAMTIRTVGVHPWQAERVALPDVAAVRAADAVGEIGLDKACGVDFERQKELFVKQLDLAEQAAKPVVLHCVRAFGEVMALLEKRKLGGVIFHGFIGSPEEAARAVKKGYYLSFGARTESSKKTVEALRATPLERLFVETDEAETPIDRMYETIARLRGVSVEQLREATSENYKRLFRKDDD